VYTFVSGDIGTKVFACDVGSHCEDGQIITFTVVRHPCPPQRGPHPFETFRHRRAAACAARLRQRAPSQKDDCEIKAAAYIAACDTSTSTGDSSIADSFGSCPAGVRCKYSAH
jgi:hypothetical protein